LLAEQREAQQSLALLLEQQRQETSRLHQEQLRLLEAQRQQQAMAVQQQELARQKEAAAEKAQPVSIHSNSNGPAVYLG